MSASADFYTVQLLSAILKELQVRPKGQTWPAKIIVPSTTVLTIDFKEGTAKLERPDDTFTQNVVIPQERLFSITLTNDGPNVIQYSTNRALSSADADAPLEVSESVILDFKTPSIERLNLLAIGGQTTVRIVGLI